MSQPYPIPRQSRQTDILVGNGGAAYSGFNFKIFDIADVEAWTRASGEAGYTKQSPTVAKVSGLPLDNFTVTFGAVQPNTTLIVIRSARVAERTAGVDNGTKIDMTALEKELSKQATVLQEVRRDIDRGWKSDFGQNGLTLDSDVDDGDTLMKVGDRLKKGPSASDFLEAQANADLAVAAIETAATEYPTIALASAANIRASVGKLSTKFHSPNPLLPDTYVGGARYRRVVLSYLAGYPAASYFRSVDRYMPDGTTDATNGGYWVLDERDVDWRMLGVKVGNLFDATAAAQAAINFVALEPNNRVLYQVGMVYVSHLIYSADQMRVVNDNVYVVANATGAQPSLLEIKVRNLDWSGRCVADCQYKTNYETSVHAWHETSLQFSFFDAISANRAPIGYRIGNKAYPNALISEVTVSKVVAFDCPIVFEIIGCETYVSIDNPQCPADGASGDASWQARFRTFLRYIGSHVLVTGGEAIIPGGTNGVVSEAQPLGRGDGHVEWGTCQFDTVFMEAATPMHRSVNPDALTFNPSTAQRGRAEFKSCIGYHSQDIAALFSVGDDWVGDIVTSNLGFWFISGATRTQPTIFVPSAAAANVHVYSDGQFGRGFLNGLVGIAGGIVHFATVDVLRALGLNSRTFTSGSDQAALYMALDPLGDRAHFSSAYNLATGEFTIPIGGLNDVTTSVTLRLAGSSSGSVAIVADGLEMARMYFTHGCGNISFDHGDLAAGVKIKILVNVDTNDSGNASGYLNGFVIKARR